MLMNWRLPLAVDRLMTDLVPKVEEPERERIVPRADMLDTGEAYQLVVEMPGVARTDLAIELERDTLTVRGARPAPEADRLLVNGRWASRPFGRSFTLGADIDRNKIQARLENGLLTVTLPRREEVKPRRIEVQLEP